MTTGPLIVAEHLGRTYGSGARSLVAVHDVCCVVEPMASVAVVGPSGSGKSTLLHLLAGIDTPTVGRLDWPGLGAHPMALRPGTVGLVLQGPSLLPALTAVENVAFPLLLAGESESVASKAACASLEVLGLAELALLLPEELSGGQAQRVAVARALVSHPCLLIADEPTGQLDHQTAHALITAIESAAAQASAAVIISTHDPIVADRFATRWYMADGSLQLAAVR